MPWMSGLQAIRSTRAAGLPTSVIVMTALADPRIPAQVKALGANAILLRKPFELTELEAALGRSPVEFAHRLSLDRGLLVQQQLRRLDTAIGVKPALHHVIVQEISHCQQTHALMVGHPGAH